MFTLQVGFMSPSFVGIVPSIEMVIFCAVGGRLTAVQDSPWRLDPLIKDALCAAQQALDFDVPQLITKAFAIVGIYKTSDLRLDLEVGLPVLRLLLQATKG